jgi:hypothetical protein
MSELSEECNPFIYNNILLPVIRDSTLDVHNLINGCFGLEYNESGYDQGEVIYTLTQDGKSLLEIHSDNHEELKMINNKIKSLVAKLFIENSNQYRYSNNRIVELSLDAQDIYMNFNMITNTLYSNNGVGTNCDENDINEIRKTIKKEQIKRKLLSL